MIDECYCDYDPPQAYWATRLKARKAHKCCECGDTIEPGERYERVWAISDGFHETYKTCVYCLAMLDMAVARLPCFCRVHSNLHEGLAEEFLWSEPPPGLRMALGRIAVERKRDRKNRSSIV